MHRSPGILPVILLAVNIICMGVCSFGAEGVVEAPAANNAFGENEKFTFVIRWGLIRGGFSTLEVNGISEYAGRKCYNIVSRARSNKFFDTFYKVRNTNKSWMDVEGLYSHCFEKDQKEGRFRRHRLIEFLYDKRLVKVHKSNAIDEKEMKAPFLQDVLSALYYIRTLDLKNGETYTIDVCTEKGEWVLDVKVLKEETVKVPAGKFKCFKIKPEMKDDGIFKAKGDLYVWVTRDSNRIPVLLKSKILVGSIRAELISRELSDFERLFKE